MTKNKLACYRCGHKFEADSNLIDTRCPECGSDSFVPARDR